MTEDNDTTTGDLRAEESSRFTVNISMYFRGRSFLSLALFLLAFVVLGFVYARSGGEYKTRAEFRMARSSKETNRHRVFVARSQTAAVEILASVGASQTQMPIAVDFDREFLVVAENARLKRIVTTGRHFDYGFVDRVESDDLFVYVIRGKRSKPIKFGASSLAQQPDY
jgi:hypothetical protein